MNSFKHCQEKRAGSRNKVVYSIVERLLVMNFGFPVAMQSCFAWSNPWVGLGTAAPGLNLGECTFSNLDYPWSFARRGVGRVCLAGREANKGSEGSAGKGIFLASPHNFSRR